MRQQFLTALLAFLLGALALYAFTARPAATQTTEATVLLERIRNVTKLVTVEGDVSELYNSTQSRNVTLYLPLPARFRFDKTATVQVRGKVLVGYDLEGLRVDVDETTRTVRLGNLPEPEILAIDHELIYRDLEESWFNTFTAADYSALNREAKDRLRDEALGSELMDAARARGNAILETIRLLAGGAGYAVVTDERAPVLRD